MVIKTSICALQFVYLFSPKANDSLGAFVTKCNGIKSPLTSEKKLMDKMFQISRTQNEQERSHYALK